MVKFNILRNYSKVIILIFLIFNINRSFAKDFRDVVVFGDSLSDAGSNGRFIPGGYSSLNYIDIISQSLTSKGRVDSYVKGGTNYATSGSLVEFKNPLSFFNNNIYSVNEQTLSYLKLRDVHAKDSMYIYWAGGWDIYFNMIYDSFFKLLTEFTFNSYPNYKNPLMSISRGMFLDKSTQSLVSQIRSQFDNGAKYVTILNIPNSGYSPAISFFHLDILSLITMPLFGFGASDLVRYFGPNIDSNLRNMSNGMDNSGKDFIRYFGFLSLKEQFRFLPDKLLYGYWDILNNMASFYTDNYNKLLRERLSVFSLDDNIIYLDIYGLFDDMVSNPRDYGFTNLVMPACTLGVSSHSCYDGDYHMDANYFFGDWFHGNVITHEGIANYFLSVFNAPLEVSSILKQLYGSTISSNLFIESNLREVKFNKDINKVLPILGISGNVSGRSDFNYGNKNSFSNNLDLGFIYNLDSNISLGSLFTFSFGDIRSYNNYRYFHDLGDLSIFGQYLFDNGLWLNSQIGLGYIKASRMDRRINFIPNTIGITEKGDSTHGLDGNFSVNFGYDYRFSDYILSPIFGYFYGHYKVKGYKERGFRSTSMNFSDFSKDESYLYGGLEFNIRNSSINFLGQLTYNKVLNKDPIRIRSSINMASNKFSRDIYLTDDHWLSSKVSLSKMINRYNLNFNIEYRKDKTKNNKLNYSIGLVKLF